MVTQASGPGYASDLGGGDSSSGTALEYGCASANHCPVIQAYGVIVLKIPDCNLVFDLVVVWCCILVI